MIVRKLNYKLILGVVFLVTILLFLIPNYSSAKLIDWQIWEIETSENFSMIGWDEIEGASGYYLWLYDVEGREFVKAENIRILGDHKIFRNIVISGLKNDSRYRAIVIDYTINETGEYEWGSWSNWLYLQTKKLPLSLSFANMLSGYYNAKIWLNWDTVNGADGYTIQVENANDDIGYYDIILLTSGDINSTFINSLSLDSSYMFRIKATRVGGVGDSDWSSPIFVEA